MFVAAAFAHIGGALGPSCAQHAVSAAHPSASVAGCAGPAPTEPFACAVVPGGAHCAAQLWCMHAPTALPCSMQAAFIMVGAHSVIDLPPQTQPRKSGHTLPSARIGAAQLAAPHAAHAGLEVPDGAFCKHATTSLPGSPGAVAAGNGEVCTGDVCTGDVCTGEGGAGSCATAGGADDTEAGGGADEERGEKDEGRRAHEAPVRVSRLGFWAVSSTT